MENDLGSSRKDKKPFNQKNGDLGPHIMHFFFKKAKNLPVFVYYFQKSPGIWGFL